jgi:protein-arginine kinase
MELVDVKLSRQELYALFLFIQPAHLQKLTGKTLNSAERDIHRADLMREKLATVQI